jgi:undecaprenyl diphosphate synthase
MDGNGRWAKKRFFNRVKGHEKGTETVREIVRACRRIGVRVLTLYAFSTENWQRPKHEIEALMFLLSRYLKSEREEMMENNIRLEVIGLKEKLPEKIQEDLKKSMELTGQNDGMVLNLALSYGGRSEIVEMTRKVAEKAKNGRIEPSHITEETVSDHLFTSGKPDPDLLIRTSGEMRISNFLLWQIAYSEIFFTPTLWPDFTEEELFQILTEYEKRERRFGKV